MSTPSPSTSNSSLWGDTDRIARGFDRLMLYEFDVLEEHRAFVEQHFERTLAKFEMKFDEEVAAIADPEVRDQYSDHLIDEYHRLANDMPRLQWYAQFLVIYATFENALNELCRIAHRKLNRGLTVKDLGGQGINRAANFLTKVYGVKIPFQSQEWARAQTLGEIRNVIAHRNGEIEYEITKQSSLSFRIQKLNGLNLKQVIGGAETADIVLTQVFVRDAIVTLRSVLANVANHKLRADES